MTEWLDLCATQTVTDVELLRNTVQGCIIKLGYTGYGSNKPAFSPAWQRHFNALKNKVNLGVYYFTIAYTDAMVDMETEWVIKQLKEAEKDGFRFTLPICVDCEAQPNSAKWTNLSKEERSRLMKRWMDNIKAAGYYPMIYAGVNTWKHNTILVTDMLKGYDKWMAQYYKENQYPGVPGVDYVAWQYTSSGRGYDYGLNDCKVDVSHCYVDYPSKIKKGGWNGFANPALVPSEEETEEEPIEKSEESVKLKISIGEIDDVVEVNVGDCIRIERV